jgi:hypothetical protein
MVAKATVLVKEKVAGLTTPATDAVTLNGPGRALAVKVGAVATPRVFVTAVFVPPANVPDAPETGGAVNVTAIPLSGFPPPSFTVTTKGANVVFIGVLCGVPLTALTEAGVPAVTVTLAVVTATDGKLLALITAVPAPTPVTATLAIFEFAGMITVGGTVAIAGALELTLIARPPGGARADKNKNKCPVVALDTARVAGDKLIVSAA